MATPDFDFAVLGSTPLAGLLAGALAKTHKQRIVLVSEVPSAFRMPRGYDLSAGVITRPDTWSTLKVGTRDTIKLINRFGGQAALSRLDPIFVAESRMGADALAHMRFVAKGFGYPVESVKDRGMAALRVRDQWRLSRLLVAPLLQRWHDKLRIRRLFFGQTAVSLEGPRARLSTGNESVYSNRTILADDPSILALLPGPARETLLRVEALTTLLAEPAKPVRDAFVHHIERDITALQNTSRALAIYARGFPETALPSVGLRLKPFAPVRRTGQSSERVLVPLDGAPIIGATDPDSPILLAGLGPTGAFLAPVIARWLTGMATAADSEFIAPRSPSPSRAIADFSPIDTEAAAA
jgi:hypothetical protein